MARKRMKVCSCGHPNSPDNVSCENCFTDLSGTGTSSSTGQLAHLSRLGRLVEDTNYQVYKLTVSVWLIFALLVAWVVVEKVMDVGGPSALLSWLR